MTSTITLITGDGSVRVYGDNLVLDLRAGSVGALLDTPTDSPEAATVSASIGRPEGGKRLQVTRGPNFAAEPDGCGPETIADDGRNVEASGGAASVITNSETPAGPLPTPGQADSAGEAVPPTSPAPLSTGATVAKTGCDRIPASAPVAKSAKKLRPHCRRPELCGSGTRDHCHACKLAMGESEVVA